MYVKVRVIASARKEECVKVSNDHYDIKVKEPAERNLANNRICELIAREFSVASGAVRIINGHHSPSKLLSITIPE